MIRQAGRPAPSAFRRGPNGQKCLAGGRCGGESACTPETPPRP